MQADMVLEEKLTFLHLDLQIPGLSSWDFKAHLLVTHFTKQGHTLWTFTGQFHSNLHSLYNAICIYDFRVDLIRIR